MAPWSNRLSSGKETARIEHGGNVRGVAFSPDSRWLATAGGKKVTLLSPNPQNIFVHLCNLAGRNLNKNKWERYIGSNEPWISGFFASENTSGPTFALKLRSTTFIVNA